MTTLDDRSLNRARLHRQWLTEPRRATALEAVEHLVGLQAQLGDPPYYQLWSRLLEFGTDELSAALHDRSAVRVVLMRGTIHLVTAADALRLRPVVQPYLTQTLFGNEQGKQIAGVDPDALAAEGERLLAAGPMHVDDLAAGLAKRFDGLPGPALAYGLRGLVPLIQTPPRGVWGQGGGLTYASTRQWLGTTTALDPEAALDAAIPRYLAAYGPATVQDFQTWSSRTRTAAAFTRLRERLTVHHDATGRELFDVPGAVLPDRDQPLEPLLLGGFDNILLSYKDREFIISKAAQKRVFTHNGIIKGTILLDGFVAGSWKPTVKKKTARVDIEPFTKLTNRQREQLEHKALALLDFAAPAAETRAVEFAAA